MDINQNTNQAPKEVTKDDINGFPAYAVVIKETFNFKRRPVLDEKGEQKLDEKGEKLTFQPKPVTIEVPYLDFNAFVALVQDEQQQTNFINYCVNLVNDAVYSAAQAQVTTIVNSGKNDVTYADLNYTTLGAMYLATQPTTSGRGGIPKELWPEWTKSFIHILTTEFKVSTDGATKCAKFIQTRFAGIETNKPVLSILRQHLNNWFAKASDAEQRQFTIIYQQMIEKIDSLEATAEQNILASIM